MFSTKKFTQLTPGINLTGAEIFALVQGGISKQSPISSLFDYISSTFSYGPGINYDIGTKTLSVDSDLQLIYDNSLNGSIDLLEGKPFGFNSTVTGFFLPSMTNAESISIVSPLNGLMTWSYDDGRINLNIGTPLSPNHKKIAYLDDIEAIEEDVVYGETYISDSTAATFFQIPGTFNVGSTQEFNASVDGTLTCLSTINRKYSYVATISSQLNLSNDNIFIAVFKNDVEIPGSRQPISFDGVSPSAKNCVLSGLTPNMISGDTLKLKWTSSSAEALMINFKVHTIGGTESSADQVVQAWNGLTTPTLVTAGTYMSITGGVISTTAQPNVVASWNGSASPVDITAGYGMNIDNGVISLIPQTGTEIIKLASCRIPTVTYPAGTGYHSLWSTLNGSSTVPAGTLLAGQVIEVRIVGVFFISVPNPSSDSGSNIRIKFGTVSITSDPILIELTNTRTLPFELTISLTNINNSQIALSVSGQYLISSGSNSDAHPACKSVRGFYFNLVNNGFYAFSPGADNDISVEFQNGLSGGNTFNLIANSLTIKKYL